jgi:ParB family chromosome partitioning protein
VDQFTYTQEQLSKIIGKSRSHVANTLRLLGLPAAVQALISDGALSAGHARTLIGHAQAEALAKEIVAKGLSVRGAEALTRKPASPRGKGRGSKPLKDADTAALEKNITNALGLSVSIHHKGEEGGTVTVSYKSLEQLDEICRRLSRT